MQRGLGVTSFKKLCALELGKCRPSVLLIGIVMGQMCSPNPNLGADQITGVAV